MVAISGSLFNTFSAWALLVESLTSPVPSKFQPLVYLLWLCQKKFYQRACLCLYFNTVLCESTEMITLLVGCIYVANNKDKNMSKKVLHSGTTAKRYSCKLPKVSSTQLHIVWVGLFQLQESDLSESNSEWCVSPRCARKFILSRYKASRSNFMRRALHIWQIISITLW